MSLTRSKGNALSSGASQLPATAGADPTYYLPKVEAGRLLGVILRRGWILLLFVVLGAAGLYAYAKNLPQEFRAHGSVYVSTQAPVILDIRAVAPEETRDLEQMRSVEQGMLSSTLIMRILEKHGLAEDPKYAPDGTGPEGLRALLASRVRVELRRGTRIIDITVDDRSPERAKLLVESLVSEYEAWTNERQQAITTQASEGLTREEVRLREKMAASAQKLQDFRESHPVPGLEGAEGVGPVRDELGTLSAQLTATRAERLKLEAEYEAFVKFDAADPNALAGLERSEQAAEVLTLVRTIQQKEADFSRIKERYLHKHPVYQEISSEITLLESQLATTARSAGEALEKRYAVAKENENKLIAEVARARTDAVEVEGLRDNFRALSRDADADRELHQSVAARLRETSLAASVPASVLRWEDSPLVPEKSHSPRKIVYAAIGLFGGFFLGLALLVGLELGDGKVRDTAAAARATGSPLLATVARADGNGEGMVLMSDPDSDSAESFRRLRAVLAPAPGGSAARTVLFASSKAGEGRSFCAFNYAASLAMQGHRTLLLDADLRHAGLSAEHLDGNSPDAGLGGYLNGKIDPAQACFSTSLQNLYLLSSGAVRADAAELMAGTRFPALLEDAYRWFDRVVIDTPPVLAVSDMLAIGRYADRICLVVSEKASDRRDLKRAADLVRGAGGNLVGFIWNEAPTSQRGNGPRVRLNRTSLAVVDAPETPISTSNKLRAMVATFA